MISKKVQTSRGYEDTIKKYIVYYILFAKLKNFAYQKTETDRERSDFSHQKETIHRTRSVWIFLYSTISQHCSSSTIESYYPQVIQKIRHKTYMEKSNYAIYSR